MQISEIKSGIFTEGLLTFQKDTDQQQTKLTDVMLFGEYLSEPLEPYAYLNIFESVLLDIFPWAETFINSKTTSDTLMVVLSKQKVTRLKTLLIIQL